MTLEWLGDDGPLVLLAEAGAGAWLGAWRPATEDDDAGSVEVRHARRVIFDPDLDEDEPATDYARVCAKLEPPASSALVSFDGGVALALETTGHQAALVSHAAGLIVAKWVFAKDEAAAATALQALPVDLAWADTGVRWSLETQGVVLHVAADRFQSDGLRLQLPAGDYAVSRAVYEPDDDTSFELWRLSTRV